MSEGRARKETRGGEQAKTVRPAVIHTLSFINGTTTGESRIDRTVGSAAAMFEATYRRATSRDASRVKKQKKSTDIKADALDTPDVLSWV